MNSTFSWDGSLLSRLTRSFCNGKMLASTVTPMKQPTAPRMPSFFLHWVNVIVLAEFHNPSILNPDFLKINDIVPADWTPVETLTTPGFAHVRYSTNVSFQVDQGRLEITKQCEGSFQDDYAIHEIAAAYVEKLPHVRYTSVGFNWHMSLEKDEPGPWLTEHFVKKESLEKAGPKLLESSVKLTFELADAKCNLDVAAGMAKIPDKKDTYPAVIINANFHHQGPFSAGEIKELSTSWKAEEDHLRELLPKLFGEVA